MISKDAPYQSILENLNEYSSTLACLSPIAIIFIVMKLAVFLSGIYSEEKYVESDQKIPDLSGNAYTDIDEEEGSMEIAQTIDEALYQFYVVERDEEY